MLVEILARIVQLILDHRMVRPRAAQHVGVALRPDRQDDGFGSDRLSVLKMNGEITLGPFDLGDFSVQLDIDALTGGLFVPYAEDCLALACFEVEIAAQHQIGGRRHDVLALLVFEDRVGEMVGLFEQDMTHAQRRRAGRSAQSGRTGTDDGDFIQVHNLSPPLDRFPQ